MILLIYSVIFYFICFLNKTSACNNDSYQKYIQETKNKTQMSKVCLSKFSVFTVNKNNNIKTPSV